MQIENIQFFNKNYVFLYCHITGRRDLKCQMTINRQQGSPLYYYQNITSAKHGTLFITKKINILPFIKLDINRRVQKLLHQRLIQTNLFLMFKVSRHIYIILQNYWFFYAKVDEIKHLLKNEKMFHLEEVNCIF